MPADDTNKHLLELTRIMGDMLQEEQQFRRTFHEDIQGAIDSLTQIASRLEVSIVGDEYGNLGLVARVDRVEDRQERISTNVSDLQSKWERVKWTALGWGVGAGLGSGGLLALFIQLSGVTPP